MSEFCLLINFFVSMSVWTRVCMHVAMVAPGRSCRVPGHSFQHIHSEHSGQLARLERLPKRPLGLQTTPGCNEGLRWHVFNQQDAITSTLMQTLEKLHAQTVDDTPEAPRQFYRHNNRPIQPLNDRTVYFHDSGAAAYPGSISVSGCYGDEL